MIQRSIAGMLERHCSLPLGTSKTAGERGKKITSGILIQVKDLVASNSGAGAATVPDEKTTKSSDVELESNEETHNVSSTGSEEDAPGIDTSTSCHAGINTTAMPLVKQWVVVAYPGKRKNTQPVNMRQIINVI